MRPVETPDGERHLLLSTTDGAARLRDPATGEERTVDADAIEPADDEALSVAAEGVPEPVRQVVTAAHDERTLGVLVTLVDDGPTPVVDLLSHSGLCESDFNGLFAELRAAGLVTECRVAGERGYEATETAAEAVELLRADAPGADDA
ncbi:MULTISPECIES: DUF7346 family protein [Halolamina]|uniref:HTH domain protein n=1 Tax=Halolamina pelagica TaxID=699431 RepID=A0A1I5R3R2_9EURY|nr:MULTISPECIES: hypothetical protein [Halolamina]NHX35673.1 hypothetical protein [Halolamina sp. R1-12]SFP53142.1 hypothetical protein SAMN05216277_104224 [Halolamina pelagica]